MSIVSFALKKLSVRTLGTEVPTALPLIFATGNWPPSSRIKGLLEVHRR